MVNQNQLLPGDIILVRGMDMHRRNKAWLRWLVAWIISRLTNSIYTHAALYNGVGDVIECDVGVPVRARPVTELSCYDVYRVRGATDADRLRAVRRATEKIGKQYDYTAVLSIGLERLFGVPFPWAKNDPNKWFCSELDADSWLMRRPGRIVPGDLATSGRVGKVELPQEAA